VTGAGFKKKIRKPPKQKRAKHRLSLFSDANEETPSKVYLLSSNFQRPSLENDCQTYNFDGFLPPLVEDWMIFRGGRLHYLAAIETFTANFSFAFGTIPFIYRYFAICW
jgi:hypothetical protein